MYVGAVQFRSTELDESVVAVMFSGADAIVVVFGGLLSPLMIRATSFAARVGGIAMLLSAVGLAADVHHHADQDRHRARGRAQHRDQPPDAEPLQAAKQPLHATPRRQTEGASPPLGRIYRVVGKRGVYRRLAPKRKMLNG